MCIFVTNTVTMFFTWTQPRVHKKHCTLHLFSNRSNVNMIAILSVLPSCIVTFISLWRYVSLHYSREKSHKLVRSLECLLIQPCLEYTKSNKTISEYISKSIKTIGSLFILFFIKWYFFRLAHVWYLCTSVSFWQQFFW